MNVLDLYYNSFRTNVLELSNGTVISTFLLHSETLISTVLLHSETLISTVLLHSETLISTVLLHSETVLELEVASNLMNLQIVPFSMSLFCDQSNFLKLKISLKVDRSLLTHVSLQSNAFDNLSLKYVRLKVFYGTCK